jgi:hypothetical protein
VSKVATSQSGMFEPREGAATFNYNNLEFIFRQCNKKFCQIFSFLNAGKMGYAALGVWWLPGWAPQKIKNKYLKNNF